MKLTVLTQKNCTRCTELISRLNENKIPFILLDAESKEGRKLAAEKAVLVTPAAFFTDDKGKEIARGNNFEEIFQIFSSFFSLTT